MKTIVSVASARPNFVKLAAIAHRIPDGVEHVIIHTGQHYDPSLSDVFFEQLHIPQPSFNLGVHGGTREEVIDRTEKECEKVLQQIQPDVVLVYGDVNGAVGAARAAKKLQIKLGHVEAGLRSGDLEMPEEHNRIEIDQLADILFCSERSGVDHLKQEKVKGEIHLVGNTMIDTLIGMEMLISETVNEIKHDQMFQGKFGIATIHRPSNVDDPSILKEVMRFLEEISNRCRIVLPPHPRLKIALQSIGYDVKAGVPLSIEDNPRDYLNFLAMMKMSAFIITDSGGIQEEAVLLHKRCFTLRRNTERPSTIESGSNVLIDINKEEDRRKVLDFAKDPHDIDVKIPEKWDGHAGEEILRILLNQIA